MGIIIIIVAMVGGAAVYKSVVHTHEVIVHPVWIGTLNYTCAQQQEIIRHRTDNYQFQPREKSAQWTFQQQQ